MRKFIIIISALFLLLQPVSFAFADGSSEGPVSIIDFVYRYAWRAKDFDVKFSMDPLFVDNDKTMLTFGLATVFVSGDSDKIETAVFDYDKSVDECGIDATLLNLSCFFAALNEPVFMDELNAIIDTGYTTWASGFVIDIINNKKQISIPNGSYMCVFDKGKVFAVAAN